MSTFPRFPSSGGLTPGFTGGHGPKGVRLALPSLRFFFAPEVIELLGLRGLFLEMGLAKSSIFV